MACPRKRENDQTTQSWLLDVLECPVCLEPIMETPIYVCANKEMHSTCLACYKQLKNDKQPCPVCRKKLTDRRSIVLEKLVESMPMFYCKHKGCLFKKITSGPVRDHEENECEWRMVPCGKCGEEVSLTMLDVHLVLNHGCSYGAELELSKARNYQIDLRAIIKDQSVIKVEAQNESLLLFANWLKVDETCLIYWLSYQVPKKDAAKYKYTLKVQSIKGDKTGKTTYLYEGTTRCVPCDISHEQMKEAKEGLLLRKKFILAVSEVNDNMLQFSVKIALTE